MNSVPGEKIGDQNDVSLFEKLSFYTFPTSLRTHEMNAL